MSTITSIVYRPDHVPVKPEDHYSRVSVSNTQLIAGYGIEGDRKGGNPNRQLNIMSREALDELAADGFKTEPGAMGEQIIISGLNINDLPAGSRLQIGAEAVVELVEPRTGCERFEAIQQLAPSKAAGRLGMMCRVAHSGTIQVGDSIKILEHV
jgi:xanthine dehydrogenase accessory factor